MRIELRLSMGLRNATRARDTQKRNNTLVSPHAHHHASRKRITEPRPRASRASNPNAIASPPPSLARALSRPRPRARALNPPVARTRSVARCASRARINHRITLPCFCPSVDRMLAVVTLALRIARVVVIERHRPASKARAPPPTPPYAPRAAVIDAPLACIISRVVSPSSTRGARGCVAFATAARRAIARAIGRG